jgi:putative endonuclease
MKQFFVYILANTKNGVLYTETTSDLIKRVYQHKHGLVEGFSKKYQVKKLVYYESAEDAYSVIKREKQIKKWKRQWKIRLIEEFNPHWRDRYNDLL